MAWNNIWISCFMIWYNDPHQEYPKLRARGVTISKKSASLRHKSINLSSAGVKEEYCHFLLIPQLGGVAEGAAWMVVDLEFGAISGRVGATNSLQVGSCKLLVASSSPPQEKLVCIRQRHRPRSSPGPEECSFATNNPSKSLYLATSPPLSGQL